jgi:hypothetical protein
MRDQKQLTVRRLKELLAKLPPEADDALVEADGCDCVCAAVQLVLREVKKLQVSRGIEGALSYGDKDTVLA